MDNQPWREEFHGPGITATVRCNRGRCLLEVCLERRLHPQAVRVQVEVLLQPRDQRGLPRSSPALICDLTFPLRLKPNGKMMAGHSWLPPELDATLVCRCHFRVTPC